MATALQDQLHGERAAQAWLTDEDPPPLPLALGLARDHRRHPDECQHGFLRAIDRHLRATRPGNGVSAGPAAIDGVCALIYELAEAEYRRKLRGLGQEGRDLMRQVRFVAQALQHDGWRWSISPSDARAIADERHNAALAALDDLAELAPDDGKPPPDGVRYYFALEVGRPAPENRSYLEDRPGGPPQIPWR